MKAMEESYVIAHINCRSIVVQIDKTVRRKQRENGVLVDFECCAGGYRL
jgi:hypothetical protein